MYDIQKPYLLFLGDAPDQLAAKTAAGVAHWCPHDCLGQLRLDGCRADLGLPDLDLGTASARGARTLIVGVANRGGRFSEPWVEILRQALEAGLDLASGLHNRLADVPVLVETARDRGRRLFDVRHPRGPLEVGDGRRRAGRRLLTVGTDCSVGKMYTALALEREMRGRGLAATFRATGQTGILIAGDGISVDAVVADFISGAVEQLSPAGEPDHWDVIEGQGSLFHASFAGVSLGLLHGAQPDALVLCHEPTRTHMRGLPAYPLPDLADCIAANEAAARLTNPRVRTVGIALNTAALEPEAATALCSEIGTRFGLPCVDPVRNGVAALVDALPA
ncbi:MAG: N-acetyltransferase DgcN [Candidatus Competibacterales bacterium]|nr:N-acetyltransferase DgcN [Candidatus Competibacterales bacterium]